MVTRHPCPNRPTKGLRRVRSDHEECPSPWLCEKKGCQFRAPADDTRHDHLERRRRRLSKLLDGPHD